MVCKTNPLSCCWSGTRMATAPITNIVSIRSIMMPAIPFGKAQAQPHAQVSNYWRIPFITGMFATRKDRRIFIRTGTHGGHLAPGRRFWDRAGLRPCRQSHSQTARTLMKVEKHCPWRIFFRILALRHTLPIRSGLRQTRSLAHPYAMARIVTTGRRLILVPVASGPGLAVRQPRLTPPRSRNPWFFQAVVTPDFSSIFGSVMPSLAAGQTTNFLPRSTGRPSFQQTRARSIHTRVIRWSI